MKKMKKLKKSGIIAEFKTFISRGNVVDMATGVIVASAFTKIITSLTNNVFMPFVNWIVFSITGGEKVFLITILNKEPYFVDSTDAAGVVTQVVNSACIYINWGDVIEATVNFLLVAMIIFTLVKILNSINAKIEAMRKKLHEDELKLEAEKAKEAERIANEQLAQQLAEQAIADKEKAQNTSTNALLVEIINLLKK